MKTYKQLKKAIGKDGINLNQVEFVIIDKKGKIIATGNGNYKTDDYILYLRETDNIIIKIGWTSFIFNKSWKIEAYKLIENENGKLTTKNIL